MTKEQIEQVSEALRTAVGTETLRSYVAELKDMALRASAEGEPVMEDEVEWVVNDIAELGVKVRGRFFFLYKGYSLVYGTDGDNVKDGIVQHDKGGDMHWRPVGKREFGECCHPVNYKEPNKWGTVSLSDSDEWKPLPAYARPAPSPCAEGEPVITNTMMEAAFKADVPTRGATLEDCYRAIFLAMFREMGARPAPSGTRDTKIDEIAALPDDWDSYGARAFTAETVQLAREVSALLDGSWQVVPCSDESIQFERHDHGLDQEIAVFAAAYGAGGKEPNMLHRSHFCACEDCASRLSALRVRDGKIETFDPHPPTPLSEEARKVVERMIDAAWWMNASQSKRMEFRLQAAALIARLSNENALLAMDLQNAKDALEARAAAIEGLRQRNEALEKEIADVAMIAQVNNNGPDVLICPFCYSMQEGTGNLYGTPAWKAKEPMRHSASCIKGQIDAARASLEGGDKP